MIQRELIDRYFRNECSDDERKRVLEYFRDSPAEWNRYMTEEDWDNFVVSQEVDPALSEKMFKAVSSKTLRKSRKMPVAWLAAAAVAGLLIGLLWIYRPGPVPLMAKRGALPGTAQQMTERKNTSNRPMSILLADSSVVTLSPHSSIRFYEPFVADKGRIIYLSGEALFKVTGDKDRPFVVYADKLATTVLGTSFTVQSFAESKVITLTLHEGKVQAAAADSLHAKWKSKVVLLPGDVLTYNKATMLASLKRNAPAGHLVKAGPANSNAYTVHRPDWYTFDASLLSEVFDQLSSYYQVDIYYYPADLQHKYFSGRLHKTDSLETILNDIALLNHLTIEKKEGSYIIRKKN
ncbi:FecR family protein [Chitinophaga varians]|uniref:FecR family protein n=1 Tax=Chitinophaga varians TaxID=2202339 RepID=UPI00165FACA2|nr:FecR domain-containing protein [Chitinophaga varians]MBC9912790.1 FecR family protein [Chitinophaga varians]